MRELTLVTLSVVPLISNSGVGPCHEVGGGQSLSLRSVRLIQSASDTGMM
jgi:hypothetical protein